MINIERTLYKKILGVTNLFADMNLSSEGQEGFTTIHYGVQDEYTSVLHFHNFIYYYYYY